GRNERGYRPCHGAVRQLRRDGSPGGVHCAGGHTVPPGRPVCPASASRGHGRFPALLPAGTTASHRDRQFCRIDGRRAGGRNPVHPVHPLPLPGLGSAFPAAQPAPARGNAAVRLLMERLVLGVFPGLGGPNAGGIQAYGRLAWQAVATHTHAQGGSAGLLVYGQADASDLVLGDASSFAAASKWRVLRAALTRTWRAPLVCFWHLHLLRLLPLLRVGPAKVVLFLNGIEAWCDPGTILRRLLQRVDLFLSISDFTWRRFLEFHPQLADRPHRTVHLGLEEPTAEVESPEDPPAALILGRIVRQEDYKGHRELIRIWPRVLQRIPKARLWIVGDGDLRPDLEQLSHELKVADFVR